MTLPYLLPLARRGWHTLVIAIVFGALFSMASISATRANASEEPDWKTFIARAGGQSYPIEYWIAGGRVVDMVPSEETASFTVVINSTADGRLTIKLPRELVDARDGADGVSGPDTDFAVFVDEEIAEVNDIEATSATRTLAIDFDRGTENIDIVGTLSPYPITKEWTAQIVGKFLNSEPPKPDQIFHINYRVTGGTVESFDIRQEIDDVFVHNGIAAKVTSSSNGTLEIKFPRNFPYTNTNGAGIEDFIFLVDDEDGIIEDGRTTTDCFFVFSIPFTGSIEIEMALGSILIKSPYHGDNITDDCIPQTTVENVPTRNDGTITPLQQFRAGVAAEDVMCRQPQQGEEEFKLMISPSGKPYCVKPSNEGFMKARGWTTTVLEYPKASASAEPVEIIQVGESKEITITNADSSIGETSHKAVMTVNNITFYREHHPTENISIKPGFGTLFFNYTIKNIDHSAFYVHVEIEAIVEAKRYPYQLVSGSMGELLLPGEDRGSWIAFQVPKGAEHVIFEIRDSRTQNMHWNVGVNLLQ